MNTSSLKERRELSFENHCSQRNRHIPCLTSGQQGLGLPVSVDGLHERSGPLGIQLCLRQGFFLASVLQF